MKKIFVLLCCLVCLHPFAQRYSVKYFTDKEGLSNNNVNVVWYDDRGFLWAGTDNGLDRFDGNSFDIFQHNPADTNSIAGNKIYAICQDKQRRLWLGTSEGISLYRPGFQNFQNFAPDTFVLKNIGTLFIALKEDDRGRIWVGTTNDLLVFDPQTKKFSSSGWAAFAQKNSPADGNHLRVVVQGILKKSPNEFWVFTTYGLYSVNIRTLAFQFYPLNRPYDYFGSQMKYADEDGRVWIALFGAGLLVFDSRQNSWTEIPIPKEISDADNSFSLRLYSGDTLMFASSGYIVFLSRTTHQVLGKAAFDEALNKSLPGVQCTDIQKHGEALWLATARGLAKLSPAGQFVHFQRTGRTNTLFALYPGVGDDKLIYTDMHGVYIGDSNFKKIDGALPTTFRTRYFAKDSGQTAYITDEKNVYRYDMVSGALKNIPLPPPRNPQNDFEIRNIVIDKRHHLWIRTLGQGVIHYDPFVQKTQYESNLPDGKNNLLLSLYYDSTTNCLWLSEEGNGAYCYHLSSGEREHFLLNTAPSQRGATLFNITADWRDNIWMSNLNTGILFYDREKKVFKQFTTSEGLLSDNVSWLTSDPNGFIWVSTDIGISRINCRDNSFTNYSSSDGYPQANYHFIISDKNGNIYLAADSGYYYYDTKNLSALPPFSAVYLRNLTVNNQPWPVDSVYHFSPRENSLQFLPGILNLDAPQPAALEYRLNKGDWITIRKNSAILLASLGAGNYRLVIRQKNNPDSQLSIPFTIRAPLWKRAWFLVALAICLSVLFFYVMRRRFAHIRRQSALQEEKTKSEITALRSQMNPHFIFNTLNSINSYIIENKNEEAAGYLTEFSKLIRLTLQHSQQENILLQDELNAVKLYLELECKRLGQNFDYTILLKPGDSILQNTVPSMIIQPFVENAIWHGLRTKNGEKHILIDIEEKEGRIHMIIEDNGIGRPAAARNENPSKKDSFGMGATIKRLQLYDASSQVLIEDLQNGQGAPAGTRILISFKKINNETAD